MPSRLPVYLPGQVSDHLSGQALSKMAPGSAHSPLLGEPGSSSVSGPVVIALDFETSDRSDASACALGMVRIEGDMISDNLYALIRPPSRRVCFTDIHGLTWDMLKNNPTFEEQWENFAAFFQGADYLLAHNAPFDRRVLYGCCRASNISPPNTPFLCTLKGARRGLQLPHNKLSDVCAHLGIELEHHQAASDAMAAAQIYLYLRKQGLPLEAMLA